MTLSLGKTSYVVGMLALAAGTLATRPAEAQYFGRNKVQYEQFDFQVLKTEHFDLFYYPAEREAALLAGRMAERWYSRLSRLLNHELKSRQPLIIYANHPHFEQTNAIAGELGESTGGVTEVFKRRIVLPFAGGLRETDHVIGHELVHAFQFDITGQGRSVQTGGIPGALRLPLWFIEGMAEYLSVGPVDPNTAMWLREAAQRELPSIRDIGDPYKWFPYRWGQALWSYVAGRYGDEVVGRLLKTAGRSADPDGAMASLLGLTPNELSAAWQLAIHEAYDPLVELTTSMADYGSPVFAAGPAGGTSISPVLSPDGSQLAFISARDLYSIDVFIGQLETGEIRHKITQTAVDPHFESLQFINSAGTWSPDGRSFAIAGISRGKAIISIIDVESGDITRNITLAELGEIYNPAWSPNGRFLAFSAIRGGLSDLFLYDLDESVLRRITNDPYADLQPAWSPDGTRIAFVTDRFTTDLDILEYGDYQLATIDPFSGAIEHIPCFVDGNHTNPQWTPDGRSILFLSDRTGITNLYRLGVADGSLAQITNLYTGITGITPLSPALTMAADTELVVISVYEDDGYHLYSIDRAEVLDGTEVIPMFATLEPARLPPAERITDDVVTALADPTTGLADTLEFETRPYSARLALDYIAQPSLLLGTNQFGTFIGGGAALYWSDMLGNRNLTTALQVNGGIKDVLAIVGYTNLSRRWNWAVFGQQIPITSGFFSLKFENRDGEAIVVEELIKFRQTSRQISGLLFYPFSRVRRVEFSAAFNDVRFEQEIRSRGITRFGDVVFDSTFSFSPFESLQSATATAALVYDNSLFGATSPIIGQRYRLQLSPILGSVKYLGVLADYRRYLTPVRPFTIAARIFHFGRYGGDSEDERLRPLYLGYPGFIRGYDDNSFDAKDCQPSADDPCPLFSRLLGSKIAMANLEFRFPLLGALGIGSGYYGFFPVEFALFGDAGLAWCEDRDALGCSSTFQATAEDKRAFFLGGSRRPVYSAGAAIRMNLLGFMIVEIDYTYAFQRNRWIWQFGFIPGF